MPPRRKGKKDSSKPRTTRPSVKTNDRKTGKLHVDSSAQALAPPSASRSGLRTGLRSRPSAEPAPPFEDNPDLCLRKHRNSRKFTETEQAGNKSEVVIRTSPGIPSENTFNPPAERYWLTDRGIPDESFTGPTPILSEETDPEQKFNRKWRYLPPLDEEASAVIEAIIADPSMAQTYTRISADHQNFRSGLSDRNVLLEESEEMDPQLEYTNRVVPGLLVETNDEKESYGRLWALDRAKCNTGSKEALFQRTIMMSLIARHRLIYARDPNAGSLLDFSVEEPWGCPPMPTRAYWKGESFLTQPKPDLAVAFVRKTLIPDKLWKYLPRATTRLACYENIDDDGEQRVFHFFTIEAKRANKPLNDTIGMRQSLNNASQALHNMYEFFREAGPDHEDEFFAKVRFFSVVASTGGITIRIHRATRELNEGPDQDIIIPGYPLKFEYKEFCEIPRDKFERQAVLETFERILFGYGVKQLHPLLKTATGAVVEKLRKDDQAMFLRGNENFYRYGQIVIPPSKRTTPAPSREQSVLNNPPFGSRESRQTTEPMSSAQSRTTLSLDMSRFGVTQPGREASQTPSPVFNDERKRRKRNN